MKATSFLVVAVLISLINASAQSVLTFRNDLGVGIGETRLWVPDTAQMINGPSGIAVGDSVVWTLDAGWNDQADTAYFMFYAVGHDANAEPWSGEVATFQVSGLLQDPGVVNGSFSRVLDAPYGEIASWQASFVPVVVPEPGTNSFFLLMGASLLILRPLRKNRVAGLPLRLPGPLEQPGCSWSCCGYAGQWPTNLRKSDRVGGVIVGAKPDFTISEHEVREAKNKMKLNNSIKFASLRKWVMAAALVIALGLGMVAQAQTTNFPSVDGLITGPQQHFNTALTWVIGAVGVLMVIGWIMKAMRGRK